MKRNENCWQGCADCWFKLRMCRLSIHATILAPPMRQSYKIVHVSKLGKKYAVYKTRMLHITSEQWRHLRWILDSISNEANWLHLITLSDDTVVHWMGIPKVRSCEYPFTLGDTLEPRWLSSVHLLSQSWLAGAFLPSCHPELQLKTNKNNFITYFVHKLLSSTEWLLDLFHIIMITVHV